MNQTHVLYHMVRADFLERARRYSFLLTLAGALYLAYGVAADKVWIVIGDGYRGVYNSAWIGALTAVCCSTFLSLAGFYIVKNSVQRDTETRVGQILVATPMRKSFYALAKTISNFAVLASMVLILMLAAVVMQLLRAEVRQISLWNLWSPFLLITLPAMAITAALALLFETVPLLRGGLGNVLYFFLWTAGLALSVTADVDEPTGLRVLFRSMRDALHKVDPAQRDSFSLTIGGERAVHVFYWGGVDWNTTILGGRVLWTLVAVGLALVASVFFHRFDPAFEWRVTQKKAQPIPVSTNGESLDRPEPARLVPQSTRLTPLAQGESKSRFVALVGSELRLMIKGLRWWWYVVAGGLFVGSLASPAEASEGVLIAAWIWPVLVWSQMGSREARNATQSLIFSAPRALYRQLPAAWAAGVVVAALTGGGVAIRLLVSANWHALAAWFAGVLFIPSMALALGVWSGSSKPFEALYTVWWYIGPAHQSPGFDFMGTSPASQSPMLYLLIAAALLAAAYWGRRIRLAYA
jgi:hypothetical protein